MQSTSLLESPSATDHKVVPRQLPARGYEPQRPELEAAPGAMEAALRLLGAAAADVSRALDRGGSNDPLDKRDPEYMRETLPVLRLLSSVYFRADVQGMDNVPAAGPVLLVGNHSGGTMIACAKALGSAGATMIDAVVTHALFPEELCRDMALSGIRSIRSTHSVPHSTNAIALDELFVNALQGEIEFATSPETFR